MPEIRALRSLTIGEGKKRTMVAPGDVVTVTQATFDELAKHYPPVIEDPRQRDQNAGVTVDDNGAAVVSRVATPLVPGDQGQPEATEGRSPRTDTDNGTTTRDEPKGEPDKDDL